MYYMSLEDWRQEYAHDIFEAVIEDFGLEPAGSPPVSRPAPAEHDDDQHGSRVRFRGVADEDSITWLI